MEAQMANTLEQRRDDLRNTRKRNINKFFMGFEAIPFSAAPQQYQTSLLLLSVCTKIRLAQKFGLHYLWLSPKIGCTRHNNFKQV